MQVEDAVQEEWVAACLRSAWIVGQLAISISLLRVAFPYSKRWHPLAALPTALKRDWVKMYCKVLWERFLASNVGSDSI